MANPPRIRNYQDLRYKFIRGLTKHEHQQRRHQFLKQAAEWTSKAIVSLSLASEPIRSARQATQLEGVGAIIRSRLDKIQAENGSKADPPNPGKHVSTAAGLLVALLNESEAVGASDGGKPLVPEPDLKEACQLICEENFNKIQTSVDGAPVLCTAWWRINVLISRGFVKKRTRGKQAVYELLPEGENIARRLRGNYPPPLRIRSVPPLPHRLAANGRTKTPSGKKKATQSSGNARATEATAAPSTSNFQGPLYCHDRGTDGVLMLVDDHELGGDRVRLGELCRRLKECDVQHKTTSLPCGDYLWLWRENGKEVSLPILVERKRADDLAGSMRDGRFLSQKDKMIRWREEFGMLSDEVSLQYVVESTPEAYRVKCMDGCNGVGKCGNPTVDQVRVAMKELEKSRDFTLIKTKDLGVTVEYLTSITVELQQRVTNGDFNVFRLLHQDRPSPSTDLHSRSTTSSNKCTVTSTVTKHCANSPTTAHAPTMHSTKKYGDSPRSAHAPTQPMVLTSGASCSPKRAGTKRRVSYVAIDVDDFIGGNIKRERKDVYIELLDDSQEDHLFNQSPFDNSSCSSKRKSSSSKHTSPLGGSSTFKDNSSLLSHESDRKYQQDDKNYNDDEEAKLVAVSDVMPDASLEEILSALCSSGGNVELAVAELLDNPHNRSERHCNVKKEEYLDLT